MVCPKCQASVANDSNFCPRCGTPFGKRNGFVANLWRENKPGFLVLSLLLVAMLGSIGYYLYSRTGKFVVTIESVSKDEAIDFYTKAASQVYCREFAAECQNVKPSAIETEIKRVIPGLFRDNAGGYARMGNAKNYYQPKIDRLREVSLRGGNLPFEHRVDLALTIATVEHSVPFTLQSGESKTWCLVNETANRERQIEYAQDGKTYETPVLRQKQT
jgi:hypothetical protein